MPRISWSRIILCGLLAGVVINTFEFVLHFFVLEEEWREARGLALAAATPAGAAAVQETGDQPLMTGSEIAASNLWGFLLGLLTLWLYAAIRPRFGSRPKTAVYAAATVWALAFLLAALKPTASPGLPMMATVIIVVVGFVEIFLGALLGAWQYLESEALDGAADTSAASTSAAVSGGS